MPERAHTPDEASERLTNELNLRFSELENLYEKKFQAVNGKLVELRQRGLDALLDKESEIAQICKYKDEEIEALKAELAKKDATFENENIIKAEYITYIKEQYEKALTQLEREHDSMLTTVQGKLKDVTLKDETAPVRSEQDLKHIVHLKRELDLAKKELQRQKQEFLTQQAEAELIFQQRMQTECDKLANQVKEQESSINSAEDQQVSLQVQLKQVELSRNVLQHQLSETQKQVEPKISKIHAQQMQLQEFDVNREQNLATINELKHLLNENKRKQTASKVEVNRLRGCVADGNRRSKIIGQNLHRLVSIADSQVQRRELLTVFERFRVQGVEDNSVVEKNDESGEAKSEISRQRDSLHRIVTGANRKASRALVELRDQKQKSILENAELLNENKKLRRDLWATQQSLERSYSEQRRLRLNTQKTESNLETKQRVNGKGPSKPTGQNEREISNNIATTTQNGLYSGNSPINRGDTIHEGNNTVQSFVQQHEERVSIPSPLPVKNNNNNNNDNMLKGISGAFDNGDHVYIQDTCRKVKFSSKQPKMPALPTSVTKSGTGRQEK